MIRFGSDHIDRRRIIMDHATQAAAALRAVNGDYITVDPTPTALAQYLEAQVHATLEVAAQVGRLADAIETTETQRISVEGIVAVRNADTI